MLAHPHKYLPDKATDSIPTKIELSLTKKVLCILKNGAPYMRIFSYATAICNVLALLNCHICTSVTISRKKKNSGPGFIPLYESPEPYHKLPVSY